MKKIEWEVVEGRYACTWMALEMEIEPTILNEN